MLNGTGEQGISYHLMLVEYTPDGLYILYKVFIQLRVKNDGYPLRSSGSSLYIHEF